MRNIKNITRDVIIALKKKGEQEMTEILCPVCEQGWTDPQFVVRCTGLSKMWGIIQCTRCGREMPFTMYHDRIQQLDTALPGTQSDKLNSLVPSDLKDDIQEAERAYYAQCNKACVAMCRRALQLSLIDKGIKDKGLGEMLKDALSNPPPLLTQNTYNLATSIKGYGDIGVHRTEKLEPKEVEIAIYMAVKMLNEVYQ